MFWICLFVQQNFAVIQMGSQNEFTKMQWDFQWHFWLKECVEWLTHRISNKCKSFQLKCCTTAYWIIFLIEFNGFIHVHVAYSLLLHFIFQIYIGFCWEIISTQIYRIMEIDSENSKKQNAVDIVWKLWKFISSQSCNIHAMHVIIHPICLDIAFQNW